MLKEVVAKAAEEEQRRQRQKEQREQDGDQPGDESGDGDGGLSQDEIDGIFDGLDLDRKLYRAINQAKDDVEEMESTVKTFGLDAGEWELMEPNERLTIAQKLNTPAMRRLADMIGRMVRFALEARQIRINDVPHVVYSVERGNSIRNVLPREFALLGLGAGPTLDFYRRYASRDLAQYKKRGQEKANRGPLTVLIDKSGSMDGEPFEWTMGAAEAMRRIAAEQERDYHAIFFSSSGDMNHFDFPKGIGSAEQVLRFCSVAPSGGTEFSQPLDAALAHATEAFDAEDQTRGDVVMISDGESYLSDAWIAKFNEERDRIGVRVHSISIGADRSAVELLNKFSDDVISVQDLTPDSIGSVFAKL